MIEHLPKSDYALFMSSLSGMGDLPSKQYEKIHRAIEEQVAKHTTYIDESDSAEEPDSDYMNGNRQMHGTYIGLIWEGDSQAILNNSALILSVQESLADESGYFAVAIDTEDHEILITKDRCAIFG